MQQLGGTEKTNKQNSKKNSQKEIKMLDFKLYKKYIYTV